jgi:hypothetical protein
VGASPDTGCFLRFIRKWRTKIYYFQYKEETLSWAFPQISTLMEAKGRRLPIEAEGMYMPTIE